jgi:hypothetical protein
MAVQVEGNADLAMSKALGNDLRVHVRAEHLSGMGMGAVITSTGIMQQGTGAHVKWVHHTPLDGERMRGHTALLGAMDTTIYVIKGGDGIRTATVVKANDSEEGEQVAFGLESIVIGRDGDIETTAPVVVAVEGATRAAQRPTQARLPKGGPNGLAGAYRGPRRTRQAGAGIKSHSGRRQSGRRCHMAAASLSPRH